MDMPAAELLSEELRPQAGIDVLVAGRLIQLITYSTDAASTPVTRRAEKTRLLGDLVGATAGLSSGVDLPPQLEAVTALRDDDTLPAACRALLVDLRPHLTEGDVRLVLLEVATSTVWPGALDWVEDRDTLVAEASAHLAPDVDAGEIASVAKGYQTALKRLRADAASPAAQVARVTAHGAVAVVSGGAATGLGSFLGSHFLGLSGAAATSAGLAFLGGGSLASGGFGMAGGAWVVHLGLTATKAGGQRVLSQFVTAAPDLFLEALARLDVLVEMEPQRVPGAVAALVGLKVELETELAALRPDDRGARMARIAFHLLDGATRPTRLRQVAREVAAEVPVEERRLARGLRGVEHELRHLQSTAWKRHAARVPRLLGVPSAAKLVDRI